MLYDGNEQKMLRTVFCAVVAVGVLATLGESARCSDIPAPCRDDQYCINRNNEVNVLCVACDPACDRCNGPNEDFCIGCAAGYFRYGKICKACDDGKFGVNCTGTCHCLDLSECKPKDGFCNVWKCARGWKEPPYCQQRCDNNTFGLDCSFPCHCPDNESCNTVNGLCAGGSCDPDYGGPGCQIRLPKLVKPPEITAVSCGQANITWLSWDKTVDLGEGPIAQYVLYREVNSSGVWQLVTTQSVVEGKTRYYFNMNDLQPDINYRFRVDVRRLDGDKVMSSKAEGFESDLIFIPCSSTTLAPTTTTVRSIIGLKVFDVAEPTLLADGKIRMTWLLTPNATSLGIDFNITLYYQEIGIGDCAVISGAVTNVPVAQTASGSQDISGIVPWRKYALTLEAFGDAMNISDILERRIFSKEIAPLGTVSNFGTRDLLSRSVTVTWIDVTCAERGGTFVQYNVERTNSGIVRRDSVNVTLISYDSLVPFTQYDVTVQYENEVGLGPVSKNFSFITEEEAPGPMTITSVTPDTTTISVSFTQPNPVNGQLTEYSITYSDNAEYDQPKTLTFNPPKSSITLDSLRAYTRYYMRMRARTNAGWGPYTANSSTTTLQDYPGSPSDLNLVYKNETCLAVSWQPPSLPNGLLENYTITYRTTSADGNVNVDAVNQDVTTYTYCGYRPGTLYLISVAASNGRGLGPEISANFWTEQGTPRAPPAPVFVNATYSSLLIEIEPVIPTSGPITKYLLHIEQTGTKRKREITVPGNVTAQLTPVDVPQRRLFEIGDGKIYGGTENNPLEREKLYNVYYSVESTLNGLTKKSYSKMKDPALTAPPVVQTTTTPSGPTAPSENNTGLIVGIITGILLFILLILLILLFLWWWCRRRNRLPAYKPQMDINSYDMPIVKDDYTAEKYWNTTYSTRESRYIVAGREYLPDDQVTMNGEAITNPGSDPVSFKTEFKSLPHEFKDPLIAARDPRNKQRNRFPHLLPYDKSRVILHPDDNTDCDYINASYISGYKRPMAYIAAQSPFDEDTVLDFWRMISQKNINTVVMITNIVEDNIVKCTQYWPENGRASYGTFLLELLDIEVFASYTIRVVAYQTADDIKGSVRIFDFTSWPEHGVPFDPIPLLEMRHKVRRAHSNTRSSILVHCGTGMGRTGTYIAIDSLIEQYRAEGRTSVYAFVKKIRRDRPFMVRTLKEYVFIYEALFEEFHAGQTLVGLELKEWYHNLTMRNMKTGHSFLKGQFRLLEHYTRRPRPEQCRSALIPVNYNKNRFPDVVPLESYRPMLLTPGGVGGRTDYINATFLDGFRVKNQFILTQTPLHTTIVDFWKLVYDYDVNTIVMMENFKHEDDTCAEYWPNTNMKPFEPFFVDTTATYQEDNVTIRNFKIQNSHKPEEAPKFVRLFQFNGWDEPNVVPTSKTLILDLLALVNDWQYKTNENTKPIIVHCRDGATHSGLYCALSIICDKISADEEVDVFHTIKHMKRRRAQIVSYPEQLRFCYKTLWDFINLRLIPEGGFTETFDGTKSAPYSLSLTSFYDTLYSN